MPRPRAETKLQHARRMVETKIATMKRLAGQIAKWQAKVRYYESQVNKSPEDRERERLARAAKRSRPRAPRRIVI